jgi:hypothetical protein
MGGTGLVLQDLGTTMALSWIKRSRRPVSVDDLVARGQYARAIDLMREESAERRPSATDRLRYADVLVLAGREAEAVPVLLGVADEQERYGFPGKALEALRRAGEIDPEHPDMNDRLQALRSPPSVESRDSPAEDLRAASDGCVSVLDGAFAGTRAPIDGVARGDEEVDTGLDSSMLAAPAPGAPRNEGEDAPAAAQVALFSDDDVGAVAKAFDEPADLSLPPGAADSARAAAALRAHFGDCSWSPRARLHLAHLMLDVGRQGDALAILAGVAEDLARNGQAKRAISVLKRVETIQRRGIREACLAPLKAGRRASSARRAARRRAAPRAVKEAAFREWVGSLLRETAMLAERSASAVEEEAEAPGEEQRRELAW